MRFRALSLLTGTAIVTALLVGPPPALASDPRLPLGDGRVTTSGPKTGYVYACRIVTGGGGAVDSVPWISGSTWSPAQKPHVQGSQMWPGALMSVKAAGSWRTLTTAGVPTNAPTGTFPISADDPAYAYDRNPNSIRELRVSIQVPQIGRAHV